MSQIGVGFLGSGPVTQAIHIPFVRSFLNELTIEHFMDVDSSLAEKLGAQHSARWTTDEDELINNPKVSVVVVGSPNSHHARQIIKSCRAGKKAVLAEKPLAVTYQELEDILEAAKEHDTKIVVGTMHAFDSAYLEALSLWNRKNLVASSIDVKCFLPANEELVNFATELISPDHRFQGGSGPSPSWNDLLTNGILGLAMHDIPIIRDFVSESFELLRAEFVKPWGYLLEGRVGEVAIRLIAQLPGKWDPEWTITVDGENATMLIKFQPSYVDNGSAEVEINHNGEVTIFRDRQSPYESEWSEIIDLVANGKEPRYNTNRIAEDLKFAFSILDQLPRNGS